MAGAPAVTRRDGTTRALAGLTTAGADETTHGSLRVAGSGATGQLTGYAEPTAVAHPVAVLDHGLG